MGKSTGPKSAAGKEIASLNAFKHGLSSRNWFDERHAAYYESIIVSLTREYRPETPTEVLMLERVAVTMTKSKRLTDIEDAQYKLAKELVAQRLKGNIPEYVHDILRPIQGDSTHNLGSLRLQQEASMPNIEIMNVINRQQNALSRQLSKELSELITIIGLRNNNKNQTKEPPKIPRSNETEWDFE